MSSSLSWLGAKAVCKNCTEDVSSRPNPSVLLRCDVCPDNLELCPECWSHGAVVGDHSPSHPYRVIDSGGFCALDSDWTAREHMVLLDSVEQFGFGNWEDVVKKASSAVGSGQPGLGRTPPEAKEEFCNTFINKALGTHTWKEEQRGRAHDHTQSNPLLPDPSSTPSTPAPNLTLHESYLLGYMPVRDDFEVEFDNDAETLVSGLRGQEALGGGSGNASDEEGEEVELALMSAKFDMYQRRLRERERRKRVAREHQLISQFLKENPTLSNRAGGSSSSSSSTKLKKKERSGDVTERLKVMAEFQGVSEHKAFMSAVGKEKEIKSRVKDLQRFRKNGIASLKDSQDYELQRLRRIKRKNELRRAAALQAANAAAATSALDDSNSCSSPAAADPAASPTKAAQMEDRLLALSALPGYDVLSQTEKKLCVNLKLTPAAYTSYKTVLLVHHLQKKKGQTPKPLNPQGLDKNNRKIIFNFLMRAGWITAY